MVWKVKLESLYVIFSVYQCVIFYTWLGDHTITGLSEKESEQSNEMNQVFYGLF